MEDLAGKSNELIRLSKILAGNSFRRTNHSPRFDRRLEPQAQLLLTHEFELRLLCPEVAMSDAVHRGPGRYILYLKSSGDIFSRISAHFSFETLEIFETSGSFPSSGCWRMLEASRTALAT